MLQRILEWLSNTPEEGGLSDIMRNSQQWRREMTKDETDWYKEWSKFIHIQRNRVSAQIDRAHRLSAKGQTEAIQKWASKQV